MGEWWEDALSVEDLFADECAPDAHEWGVAELHPSLRGMDMVHRCLRCDAMSFEPSSRDDPNRPPL